MAKRAMIGDEDYAIHIALDDRENALTNPARSKRIGGDATGFGIDRPAGRECTRQGRSKLGLDTHDPDPSGIPSGDAADQTATNNRHQERLEVRCLILEFQADGTLSEQRLGLIVSVDRQHPDRATHASLAASASAYRSPPTTRSAP
jgi:hypothetical protein